MLPTPEDASQMTGDQVVAIMREALLADRREAILAERAACQRIAQQAADRWRPGDVAAVLDGVAAAIGARQDGTP